MMKARLLLLGLCVSVTTGTPSPASAAQVDELEAGVSVYWESIAGPAWVWLFIDEGDSTGLREAFEHTFGCEPDEDSIHDPSAVG
jgi:hypothetical protein